MSSCAWCPETQLYGPLCTGCHHRVRHALGQLPMTRLELGLALTPSPQPDDAPPKHGFGPSVPIAEYVDAVIREVDDVVRTWFDVVRREARLSSGDRLFADQCRVLSANVEVLYDAESYLMTRWVPAHKVGKLPAHAQGVVTASGDAMVQRAMRGVDGARELVKVYRKAVALLS